MTIFEGIPPDGKVHQVKATKHAQKTGAKKTSDAVGTPDKIQISGKVKEFGAYLKEIEGMPDVREPLVKDMQAKVQDGTYKPDPKTIAGRIIDEVV